MCVVYVGHVSSFRMKFAIVVLVTVSYIAAGEAKCDKLFAYGVSQAEKNTIINRHNEIRTLAARGQIPGQPKAANMKRVSWDNNLAAAAQNIALTCIFEHVAVHDDRFAVGQNLYYFASTAQNKTADWVQATNGWYDEYKTYRFGTSDYNHYTQVVWADTHLVGCGYTYYQNKAGWYEKFYVCNYGSAGNYIGQTPYRVGQGCENLC